MGMDKGFGEGNQHMNELDVQFRNAHDEPEDFSLDNGNESDRSSTSSSKKGRRVYLSDDDWESDDENNEDSEQGKCVCVWGGWGWCVV